MYLVQRITLVISNDVCMSFNYLREMFVTECLIEKNCKHNYNTNTHTDIHKYTIGRNEPKLSDGWDYG